MAWASGLQELIPAHPGPSLLTVPPEVWLQVLDKLQEAEAEDIQVTSELTLLAGTTPMSWPASDAGTDPASPSSLVIWVELGGGVGGPALSPVLKFLTGPCLEAQGMLRVIPLTPLPPSGDGAGHEQARGT